MDVPVSTLSAILETLVVGLAAVDGDSAELSESSGLSQFPFLAGVWIRVLKVPLPQQAPCPLFETVRLLLAVPDGPRQRKLLPHPVLIDRSEGTTAELLGLLVVCFQPHGLQFAVRVLGELVVLQDVVEVSEIPRVERHHRPGAQDGLVLVDRFARSRSHRQRPEETAQPLDVPGLLQRLADARHLLRGEVEGR
ncbi:hypothetical protein EYF80_046630 [Liparis tanakae]|uniref:Secreted protein n=1 Tax=Liparis tanakae TaxID=230148 RepID=A0A4Z2FQW1_9TELE|nr:hypothetical protein EYF80_046630 [Liparis tanakae]